MTKLPPAAAAVLFQLIATQGKYEFLLLKILSKRNLYQKYFSAASELGTSRLSAVCRCSGASNTKVDSFSISLTFLVNKQTRLKNQRDDKFPCAVS